MKRRCWRHVVLGGLLLLCGGCSLIEDEFGWTDRLPPALATPPAPSGATVGP